MQQLDPKAVWLFFVTLAPYPLVALVAATAFLPIGFFDEGGFIDEFFGFLRWQWIVIAAPLLLIFFWVWAKLTYRFYQYELREDGFRKEYGVIWKRSVTIPYDRIQNVDVYRGVIARMLGLSDLNIQTAAESQMSGGYGVFGGDAEGKLTGLSQEVAEQLREELIRRSRQPRATNQGL